MARFVAVLIAALALSACKTTADPVATHGFTARQIAVLEQEGFMRNGPNYELGLNERVLFAVDKSDLLPDTTVMLQDLSRTLLDVGIGGATVEGHTDSTGSAQYNLALSERRAESVKDALVATGLPEGHVRPVGYGESEPIESNATPEGRQQNRRVVIVITPEDAISY